MKKKILILENFVHYRNAIESLKLYQKKYLVHLIIPHKDKFKIEKKNFKNCFFFKGPNFLIYFYVLIKSFKYNFVIISTLPEYPSNLRSIRNIIFFIVYYSSYIFLSTVLKKKLILQIRNIDAYDLKKKTTLNHMRNFFLKFTNKFICETKFISNVFKNNILKNKNLKVTYQYISHSNNLLNKKRTKTKKFYIGILGAIDNEKKNYKIIKNSFNKILISNNDIDITLVFLGKIINSNSYKILKSFNGLKIKYFDKYISEKNFKKWGSKCLFLISSINNSKKYGTIKPTGSFGDAIYLNKRLLINHSADPIKEFKSFALYFTNESQFYKNIKKLLNNKIYYKPKFYNLDRKRNLTRIQKILQI